MILLKRWKIRPRKLVRLATLMTILVIHAGRRPRKLELMELVYVYIGSEGECVVDYSIDSLRENQTHTGIGNHDIEKN